VSEITSQSITDRGFIAAADALNNLLSNAPVLNQADGSGDSSGPGSWLAESTILHVASLLWPRAATVQGA
jgi:hypothetical protein